jgi:hypothetical protein
MKVTLVIELEPDGKVSLAGPLENKLLCYGLLEIARQSVQDYDATKRVQSAAELPGRLVSLFGGR